MPPRKKQRLPSTTPTSPPPPITKHAATTSSRKIPPHATDPEVLLADPWTPSEESALFTALLHTKPTGLHKHFRMLQLRADLLSTRAIHPASVHTKIPGIWKKLGGLYDLEALDQREDARQLSDYEDLESGQEGGERGDGEAGEDDVYSVAANRIHNEEFALPEEEFGEGMWSARFPAKPQGESPGVLDEVNLMSEAPVAFTPSFSVEPAESGRGTSAEIGGEREKRGRGRPRGSGRAGKAVGGGARRSKRQVESVADEEEEDEEGEESGEGSEESNSEEEESEESTPAPKSSRGGRGRGRGGRGGVAGRGRGRKK